MTVPTYERNNWVKVNIPTSEDDYKIGCGEGVWVRVDDVAKRAYDDDTDGDLFTGTLGNDSLYFRCLRAGIDIPFETRGRHRPVVPYRWINANV